MVRKMASRVLIFVAMILQCLVISNCQLFKSMHAKARGSPIPLSQVASEFQREPVDMLEDHFRFMIMARSYGDRLYDISKNLSHECAYTVRATMLLMQQLAFLEETGREFEADYEAAVLELKNTTHLEEHPLEIFCRIIEKQVSSNAYMSPAFGKAKLEASKFDFEKRRPAYSRKLITDDEALAMKLLEKLRVPAMARLLALATFDEQFNVSTASEKRYHYFAKSCQQLAKSDKFADQIQKLFEKAIDDTVPEITVDNPLERASLSDDPNGFWFLPTMMKSFYKYIAQDAILKKELESVAAVIGKDASPRDLNFSKM